MLLTKALSLYEPERSDALAILADEHVVIGLTAVLPKGDKRKTLSVADDRDRSGAYRQREFAPGETAHVPAAKAIRLLHLYGQGAPATLKDAQGALVPVAKHAYLAEVELSENAGIRLVTGFRGEGASQHGVILVRESDPVDENDTEFVAALNAVVPEPAVAPADPAAE